MLDADLEVRARRQLDVQVAKHLDIRRPGKRELRERGQRPGIIRKQANDLSQPLDRRAHVPRSREQLRVIKGREHVAWACCTQLADPCERARAIAKTKTCSRFAQGETPPLRRNACGRLAEFESFLAVTGGKVLLRQQDALARVQLLS